MVLSETKRVTRTQARECDTSTTRCLEHRDWHITNVLFMGWHR